MVVGFDTSNYTTSVAAFNAERGENRSRLLDVKPGELGLRQSDALFSHVKRLPALCGALFSEMREPITAVGASTRPRAVEGSYMPCFLAGEGQARALASALGVPFHAFSHQQGHIAASLWSSGHMELMNTPHLAWHLSGGTTELLLVEPEGKTVRANKIGGTTDLSAGQLIDRTGLLLGLPFPSGKAVDALSRDSDCRDFFRVKRNGLEFSFSGLQNKVQERFQSGAEPAEVARFALNCVCRCIAAVTQEAKKQHPGCPVVFSGGVSSNSLLRELCGEGDTIFCPPQYSTDNAMGIAVLTWLEEH